MPDYKALYYKLLRAQNKAIQSLTQAAYEAEEQVLESQVELRIVPPEPDTKEK